MSKKLRKRIGWGMYWTCLTFFMSLVLPTVAFGAFDVDEKCDIGTALKQPMGFFLGEGKGAVGAAAPYIIVGLAIWAVFKSLSDDHGGVLKRLALFVIGVLVLIPVAFSFAATATGHC